MLASRSYRSGVEAHCRLDGVLCCTRVARNYSVLPSLPLNHITSATGLRRLLSAILASQAT